MDRSALRSGVQERTGTGDRRCDSAPALKGPGVPPQCGVQERTDARHAKGGFAPRGGAYANRDGECENEREFAR